MKKIFFYSSLLALATSCTDEFDTLNVQDEKAQGISFKSEVVESRMMWEDNGTAYEPFWYAEMDRIGVFALNARQGAFGSPTTPVRDDIYWKVFDGVATSADATYKATQSKKNGVFTSISDASTLHFDGDEAASFLAVYPSTLQANLMDAEEGTVEISNGVLPSNTQTQTGLKGDNPAQVMYAFANASRTNDYDAVGETVNLAFKRPMKALVFSTANSDEYTALDKDNTPGSSIFGQLNTITVTTKGIDGNEDGLYNHSSDIAPTALSYTAGSIVVDTLGNVASIKLPTTPTAINSIVLTIGQDWSDEALAIAAIIPNERKAYASAAEPWTIVYDFAHITLTHKFDAIPAGTKFTNYMPVPALDIQAYDYLVTKMTGALTNDRVLIVNSGTFANIFNEDGTVKWGSDKLAKTEFAEIIVDSDVVIEESDIKIINQFEGLKKLTLKSVTELKSKALKDLVALEYINMPLVTKIAADAFASTHELETVLLPAFDFSYSKTVTEAILKADHLEKLDMSGVSSMKAQFPNEGFTLANFINLSEVIVKEGVEVGPSAFYGCSLLKTIENPINLTGSSAFEASGLESIKLTNTVIPVSAFASCAALEKVLDAEGNMLKPTIVNNNAFKNAGTLEYLDLSATTLVGESAFEGVSTFKGAYLDEVKALNILYVDAETVGKNAFKGTALEYVEFTNCTVLKDGMIDVTDATLKEVKFAKPIPAVQAKPFNLTPANIDGVTLFLNPSQSTDTYDGKVFYPKGDKNAVTPYAEFTFKNITFE